MEILVASRTNQLAVVVRKRCSNFILNTVYREYKSLACDAMLPVVYILQYSGLSLCVQFVCYPGNFYAFLSSLAMQDNANSATTPMHIFRPNFRRALECEPFLYRRQQKSFFALFACTAISDGEDSARSGFSASSEDSCRTSTGSGSSADVLKGTTRASVALSTG